ncbi:HTH domain protein [compost metagenome]
MILSQWRNELAWLPVETLIHYQQADYYQILGQCDKASDCTAFIEFMLRNIADALREGISQSPSVSEEMSEKVSEENAAHLTDGERRILKLLQDHPKMSAAMLAEQIGVTSRTIERYLKQLQEKSLLQRIGPKKGGHWQVNSVSLAGQA